MFYAQSTSAVISGRTDRQTETHREKVTKVERGEEREGGGGEREREEEELIE